jgi:hypothetical protein
LGHGISGRKVDRVSRQYLDCVAQNSVVKYLSISGTKSIGIVLAEKLIKRTIANEYTELTVMTARHLFLFYSAIEPDKKKMDEYRDILINYQGLMDREHEATIYYGELRAQYSKPSVMVDEVALRSAREYDAKLSRYLEAEPLSYDLLLYTYLVRAMRSELEKDYMGLLKLCDEIINRFNNRKVKRLSGIYVFELRKVICNIQLERYDVAESIALKYLALMTKGSFNWYNLKIVLILCYFRAKQYLKAEQNHKIYGDSQAFERLPENIKEIWSVLGAYLAFLDLTIRINRNESGAFRLGKFLNEMPFYSKDKRGLNIAILIIQFLFLLHKRKYSDLIDRADALKQYCYRYLRKDDTFRSHCFIRMLLQIPRADFNRIRTERYAEPYVKKLKSVPLRVSEQSIEVEVIPYDDLWEMTLELLD